MLLLLPFGFVLCFSRSKRTVSSICVGAPLLAGSSRVPSITMRWAAASAAAFRVSFAHSTNAGLSSSIGAPCGTGSPRSMRHAAPTVS